ncbi:Hsp70 family protein [Saccharopolyspora cebuensis]|uniref:Hsp70 family protein n=1 Tax=Saccharopolyspora cebuensis TaxID=418759 RepID=A0ABV4CMD8_9PSEU
MPYVLGIHLGATATTAAVVRREGSRWAAAVPVPLGPGAPGVPTVLCRVQDGSFVAGEDARRQELGYPAWTVRGFTRRVGDDLPMLVGNDFVSAQRLIAVLVEWVADAVAHRQGHPPEHIAIAHSASWGPHRSLLVHQELARLGIGEVTMVPEPVAVALDYASKQTVEERSALVVGSVGGSGFDATVLRRRAPAFEVVGPPLETDHPGGQDLDDAVFDLVREELAGELAGIDPADPRGRALLAQVRQECVRAKEALSHQPGHLLRLELPGGRTEFALSRSRFEKLVRPHLERVPELLLQAVQSASLAADDLDAVVLAGGTARVPLLRRLVAERLERTPEVDVVPEMAAASGAARAAVQVLSTDRDQAAAGETSVLVRIEGSDEQDAGPERELPAAPRPPVEVAPLPIEPPDEERARRIKIIKLVVAALLIALGVVLTIINPGDPLGGVFGALRS